MIKAIIFDIGGVITHTDFLATYRNFAARIGVPGELVEKYHADNLDSLLLGNLSFEDFCNDMRKSGADTSLDLKEIWIDEMLKVRNVDDEVLKTIALLRQKYTVGTLTNLTESRQIVDEATDLYKNFDFIVMSCIEHIKKPDAAIYQLALVRAGVAAEEAVFVDDTEVCVVAAEKVGMKTILFENNSQLRAAFVKHGVDIS